MGHLPETVVQADGFTVSGRLITRSPLLTDALRMAWPLCTGQSWNRCTGLGRTVVNVNERNQDSFVVVGQGVVALMFPHLKGRQVQAEQYLGY